MGKKNYLAHEQIISKNLKNKKIILIKISFFTVWYRANLVRDSLTSKDYEQNILIVRSPIVHNFGVKITEISYTTKVSNNTHNNFAWKTTW